MAVESNIATVVKRSASNPDYWDVFLPNSETIDYGNDAIENDDYAEFEDNEDYVCSEAMRDKEYEDELWWEEQEWIANMEQREILDDIESDRDDWGRLEDDGWFYED